MGPLRKCTSPAPSATAPITAADASHKRIRLVFWPSSPATAPNAAAGFRQLHERTPAVGSASEEERRSFRCWPLRFRLVQERARQDFGSEGDLGESAESRWQSAAHRSRRHSGQHLESERGQAEYGHGNGPTSACLPACHERNDARTGQHGWVQAADAGSGPSDGLNV